MKNLLKRALNILKKIIFRLESKLYEIPFTPLSLQKDIKIGIIGTGKAAQYHLEALRGIRGAKVTTIVNRKSDPKELIDKYGIENHFNSIDQAIESKTFDVAINAVSTHAILSTSELLIQAGIPTLIEKPFGLNSSESQQVEKLIKSKNLFCSVAYNRRFYTSVQEAYEYIESQDTPYYIHIDAPEDIEKMIAANRSKEEIENRIILNTSHAIDLMTFFMGPYDRIQSDTRSMEYDGFQCDYHSHIEFRNGSHGDFHSHWRSPGDWTVSLYGRSYKLVINLSKNQLSIFKNKSEKKILPKAIDSKFKSGVYLQNYSFLNSVISKSNIGSMTVSDAMYTLKLSEFIQNRGNTS